MATIWFGFLLGIGLMLAFALGPYLLRLAFFSGLVLAAIAVAVVAAYLGGAVVQSLRDNPGHAWAMALTFGWIPVAALIYFGFDRFMVWLRNDPRRLQRDYSQRLEIDLHDAGYHLPRREPQLLPPYKK
ncbi:MAG: hypothetical protein ACLP19_26055 [Xanthobacteraceae bacterium]